MSNPVIKGIKQVKTFWQNLYYSGFRRIFLGLVIVVFICVNAGNFILFTFFYKALAEESEKSSMQMLTKIKNATELMYREIISLSTQLGHGNITLTRLMFADTRDRILEYQSHQIMQNAIVSFPNIDYIAVYNERLDIIFGTRHFSTETENTLKELSNRNFEQRSANLTIPLSVRHMTATSDYSAKDTVTIIIHSQLSLPDDKGALLVGIDCDYFQQLIQKVDAGDLETVMILHENGELITSTEMDWRIRDIRKMEFFNELLNYESETGSYFTTVAGDKMFISFTKSNLLNWTFISMIPNEKMTAKLVSLRNMTFFLTLIILCAGLLTSFLMAISVYKPVRGILKRLNYTPSSQLNKKSVSQENYNENEFIEKRLDYLSSTVEISEPLIKNTFILNLLKNQPMENYLANLNNQAIAAAFKEPFYLVCVFSIDEHEQTKVETQIIQRNFLLKTAVELQQKIAANVDAVALSPTDIALVIHLETGAIPDGIVPLIKETGEIVNKLGGFSASASIGSIVNSIYAINDSFEEAQSSFKETNLNNPSAPLLIRDAVKMVSNQYRDPGFSINTAAVSFNITPAYFNRIFKKYHKISYSEFLNEYRIEKACELLKTGNKSINDVASAVGINNTTYFFTLFKKIHNITPQQYRANSRK